MRKYQTPPTIADEQVKAQYDQNPTLYSTAQVHASHSLVKDEDTARQLLAEVKAHQEKFADLEREKSTDTVSAKKGGDLGTFGPGRMVPEFDKVAFRSSPARSATGWKRSTATTSSMLPSARTAGPNPSNKGRSKSAPP